MNARQTIAIHPILINGQEITIRPVRNGDTSLEAEFIQQLSAHARHYRFFGGVRQLTDEEIQKLCNVDYHDSMAFIALTKTNGITREIGVARYVKDIAGLHEMALIIADDFRHTTLGRTLAEYLIAYAKKHRVTILYSIDLHDNTEMQELAKQLGMAKHQDPDDAHQLIYSINIDNHPCTVVL